MKTAHVLIVEDEPLLCTFYKNVLDGIVSDNTIFNINVCHTFEKAQHEIQNCNDGFIWDLALIDIRLRNPWTREVKYGNDLAVLLREKMPDTRILFVSSIESQLQFYTIFRHIDPEGFIVKCELDDGQMLAFAIKEILNGGVYYSKSAAMFLKGRANGTLGLDEIDCKLLHHLAQGAKTKSIAERLDMSVSAIEKRKQHIARIFGLSRSDNEALIKETYRRMLI